MVSLVENQRSCFKSMAYWNQERAKLRMLCSLLCMPCHTAGPSTRWTETVSSDPSFAPEGHGALAGDAGAQLRAARYTSP